MSDPIPITRRKGKPSIRDRMRENICPNCGQQKPAREPGSKGPRRTFCSAPCRIALNRRMMARGLAVTAFLQAWRVDRGTGEIAQAAFAQICEIADEWNAADLAAGRPRASFYAATLLASGQRHFDRQRPGNGRKRALP